MTTLHDNFNRADQTNLGTSSEGWSWSGGDLELGGGAGTGFSIVSNQAKTDGSNSPSSVRAETDLASSDNYAQVSVVQRQFDSIGVYCRESGGNGPSGYVGVILAASDNVQLYKNTGVQNFTQIGSTVAVTVSLPQLIKVQAVGTTVKLFWDGVEKISVTDTSLTTGVRCGIRSFQGVTLFNICDSFEAGDVGGAAFSIDATHGVFALSGQTAGLRADRKITANNGSFALSGQTAGLSAGRKIAANNGSIALTGQTVALRAGRSLPATFGNFDVLGQAVALRAARRITANNGTIVLTGQDVALTVAGAATLIADAGTFALTGQAVGLKAARQLVANAGSIVLSGQAISLRAARRITVLHGAYALTGQDVTLQASQDFTLTAQNGSFTLSGQAVSLRAARVLAMGAGSILLSGQAVAFRHDRRLTAAQGAYALAGQLVTLAFSGAVTDPTRLTLSDAGIGTGSLSDSPPS